MKNVTGDASISHAVLTDFFAGGADKRKEIDAEKETMLAQPEVCQICSCPVATCTCVLCGCTPL